MPVFPIKYSVQFLLHKDVINCMECFVNYAEIGSRIRQVRKNKNLTQAKLAEAVGCSIANITNIEKSKTKLSLNMLVRIVTTLDVSADAIIGIGKSSPPPASNSIDAEIQALCAGLPPECALLCQQARRDFCEAFSRHLKQNRPTL